VTDLNATEPEETDDDLGELPEDALVADADLLQTDQALVDMLAGREGYVIPRTIHGALTSLYHVTNDGIIWDHAVRNDVVRDPIATRPFLVKQRLRDDKGEYRYVLSWLSDEEELREITVPAATLTSARKLHAELPEAIFDDTHASACVKYISRCLQENRQWLVQFGETMVTALGWPAEGTAYFVSGPDRPTPVEDVKNTGGWLKGHRERGTIDASVSFLNSVADRPQLQVMVNAALVAPVLRVVGADNFVVDLCGETSTGKTRALMLAASLWGEPTTRGVLAMWNMTRTAIEEHLSVLRGVPMFLDETQLAKAEDVGDVVYGVTQGKSRGRGKREGGLQDVTNFETALLITGEQPAAKLAESKPGVMPRIIEVTGTPCRDKEQADELTAVATRNFGHVGPAFVEHLQTLDEVALTLRLGDLRRELAGHAQSRLAGRRADSVAVLWLTNELAHAAGLVPKMDLDVWTWLMNGGDAVSAEDEDVPRKALRHLLQWAWSNKAAFYGGSDDPFTSSKDTPGRWAITEGYVAISSSLAPSILKDKLGYESPDMLFGAWKERGWLACQSKKGRTWRVPVGGKVAPAMYKIIMLDDLVDPEAEPDTLELERGIMTAYAEHLRGSG
jgi:hypothetical protein